MIDARHSECLCGAVNITLPMSVDQVEACHCPMCLRWCGSPFLSIHAPQDTVVTGDTLTVYRSFSIAERAFCSRCGSTIFYRFQDGPELTAVAAAVVSLTSVGASAQDSWTQHWGQQQQTLGNSLLNRSMMRQSQARNGQRGPAA